MWPLGHLAVGYLSFVVLAARRGTSLPASWRMLVALAVGTQLPDLIDKPLSYWGVFPSGRSVGHSLVVGLAVVGCLWLVATGLRAHWPDVSVLNTRSQYRGPIAVGMLSHLVADSYRSALAGEFWSLRYLAWPVLPAPRYTADDRAPWERLLDMTVTPAVQGELLLATIAVALCVWLRLHNE